MLLFFLALICAVDAIVVFQRYRDITCTTRVLPDSMPILDLRFAEQKPFDRTDNTKFYYAGKFTSITDTQVQFTDMSPTLTNGMVTNSTVGDGTCIEHPAFSFGRFVNIPAPAIATIERRVLPSQFFQPSSEICQYKFERDKYTWYVHVYPVQNTPFPAGQCPTEGKFYFSMNGGTEIGSVYFGSLPLPAGSGCFNITDPAVAPCVTTSMRRYCIPEANCYAPDPSGISMSPFRPTEGGIIESLRVVTTNVFPIQEPTFPAASGGGTSSDSTLIHWSIACLFVAFISIEIWQP